MPIQRSQEAESTARRDSKAYRTGVPAMTTISFILSAVILGCAVSFTFLGRNEPLLTSRTTDKVQQPVAQELNNLKDLAPDRTFYRQQVQDLLRLDEDLMRQATEIRKRSKVPGEKESRHYREHRTAMLRQQAKLLVSTLPDGKVVEGTMEWHALQDMKKPLDDYRN